MPVPYNIGFELYILSKQADDALQIIEQVIPYFAPQYTLTMKPFADIPTLTEDVPLTLNSVAFQDDYEGALEQRRTIIYTLSFEMKISFYGPKNQGSVIRDVRSNLFLQQNGLNDSDTYLETLKTTPTPSGISADSDYGFAESILDSSI
jgi:hypothetical protein